MLVAEPSWGQVVEISDELADRLVHPRSACAGEACAIHNPSHHMADWTIVLRLDKGALVERTCEHGVGHPDPDSLAWFARNNVDAETMAVHGCDGCCSKGA